MIVASQAPEPCRFFVFGPKPYAKHPCVFGSGSSWTIFCRAKGHPHKREAASKSELAGSAKHRAKMHLKCTFSVATFRWQHLGGNISVATFRWQHFGGKISVATFRWQHFGRCTLDAPGFRAGGWAALAGRGWAGRGLGGLGSPP